MDVIDGERNIRQRISLTTTLNSKVWQGNCHKNRKMIMLNKLRKLSYVTANNWRGTKTLLHY